MTAARAKASSSEYATIVTNRMRPFLLNHPFHAASPSQKVAERRLFPFSGLDPVVTVLTAPRGESPSTSKYFLLAPFGYVFFHAAQPSIATRRFRLRVCYSFPGNGVIPILFALASKQNVSFSVPLVATASKLVTNCAVSEFQPFDNAGNEVNHADTYWDFTALRIGPLSSAELSVTDFSIEAYDFYPTQADLLKNLWSKVAEKTLFSLNPGSVPNLTFTLDSPNTATAAQTVGYQFLNLFGTVTNPVQVANSDRKFRLHTCHMDANVSICFSSAEQANALPCYGWNELIS
jgi:hypothetical protein